MRLLPARLLAPVLAGVGLGLAGAPLGIMAAGVLVPHDASASVSIAVAFDALVKDADSVGIVTPVETKSVWEEGRIYSYTRVKVDQGVAGELGTGSEAWVRTMGGVVGKIGQLVDGEAVFTPNKPSLVFVRKFKLSGTWEVAARAQGQYPVVVDASVTDTSKARKLMKSAAVGVLFPPKEPATVLGPPAPATPGAIAPQSTTPGFAAPASARVRLASEVLHDRPVDDVTREIATAWKQLHPTGTGETKK